MEISKNQAAFVTISVLAVATAGSVLAASEAIATAAKVSALTYSILSVTLAGTSIASVTAFLDASASTTREYFAKMSEHAGYAIAGLYQTTSQVFVQSLIKGIADGIGTNVRRAIAGEDITVRYT